MNIKQLTDRFSGRTLAADGVASDLARLSGQVMRMFSFFVGHESRSPRGMLEILDRLTGELDEIEVIARGARYKLEALRDVLADNLEEVEGERPKRLAITYVEDEGLSNLVAIDDFRA